jgi:hypothetical protein
MIGGKLCAALIVWSHLNASKRHQKIILFWALQCLMRSFLPRKFLSLWSVVLVSATTNYPSFSLNIPRGSLPCQTFPKVHSPKLITFDHPPIYLWYRYMYFNILEKVLYCKKLHNQFGPEIINYTTQWCWIYHMVPYFLLIVWF